MSQDSTATYAEDGIYAIYPSSLTCQAQFQESVCAYLLRDYTVVFQNQVWSIDITYIPITRMGAYVPNCNN